MPGVIPRISQRTSGKREGKATECRTRGNRPSALGRAWLAVVSPLEGVAHSLVEVVDELQNPLLQVFYRGKAASLEQTAHQDAKPAFNLI